jgi:hypothetical protein
MYLISLLERAHALDRLAGPARLLPPGKTRDTLHGVWLGHPLHPVLAQAPAGTWLSASLLDAWPGSTFRVSDGTVARGPATAPQPAFRTRITDGTLQACQSALAERRRRRTPSKPDMGVRLTTANGPRLY